MPAQKVIGVIPSRYAATRLPGKPLLDLCGKPLIQWVYERALQSRKINELYVATDDERIARVIEDAGGRAILTDPGLPSGTDRVAAVARQVEGDIFVNIQGDEPLIDPAAIDQAIDWVVSKRCEMATLRVPLRSQDELHNAAVVKVIQDRNGRAIYFSRYPIPYSRQTEPFSGESFASGRHVGLYVYSREALFRLQGLPPSTLEKGESLEQLRALQDGISIGVVESDFVSIGVDTPEELEKAREILKKIISKNH